MTFFSSSSPLLVLLLLLLLTALHGAAIPAGLWLSNALYLSIWGVSAGVVWQLWRETRRTMHLLYAAGLSVYLAAEVWNVGLELRGLPYPDISGNDLLYLAYYGLILLSLFRLIRESLPHRAAVEQHLDSLIIVGSCGILMWELLLSRTLTGGYSFGGVMDITYVLLDLLLLSYGIMLFQFPLERRGHLLLSGALAAFAAADILNISQFKPYEPGDSRDLLWAASAAGQAMALQLLSETAAPSADRALSAAGSQNLQFLSYSAVVLACFLLLNAPPDGSVKSQGVLWGTVGVMLLGTLRQWFTACDNARIAEELQEQQQRLEKLAYQDNLTGLSNRAAFQRYLSGHLGRGQPYGVFSLDLNGFKAINDTHGHAAGDAILQHVARQLLRVVAPPGEVFRWGGDEFVIIIPEMHQPLQAEALAQQIELYVQTPLLWQQEFLSVGTSVGYALGTGPQHAEMLLSMADSGMYRAKQLSGQPRKAAR